MLSRLLVPPVAVALALSLSACGGSSSVPATSMPAVVGLSQKKAIAKFAGLPLRVYVYPERNRSIPVGVVFHQSPGPGQVQAGRAVAIYVSNGKHGPLVGRPFVAHP